jgi:hypothetical protein
MLPNIRAVIVAVLAAFGLLTISFALLASFRVAQDVRAGVLQADLAQRGRVPLPVNAEPRATPIIAAPEPPAAKPEYAEALEAMPVRPVLAAATLVEPVPVTPVVAAAPLAAPTAPEPQLPPTEPPIGGPLPERIAAVHTQAPPRDIAAERAAKQAAVKTLRAQRLARERKAAARRAAQLRRARQSRAASADAFGTPFGTSSRTSTFGDSAGQRY